MIPPILTAVAIAAAIGVGVGLVAFGLVYALSAAMRYVVHVLDRHREAEDD